MIRMMSLISKEILSSDIANIEDVLSEQEQKTLQLCLQHSVGRRAVQIALDGIRRIVSRQLALDFCRNGHWEESKCLDDCFWVCSCCKFPSQAIAAPKLYKYCPNCGAKMDIAED